MLAVAVACIACRILTIRRARPRLAWRAMTNVKPIPEGFSTATPNLVVDGGAEAIDFYERAFGAELQ